jgi:ribonuclease D
MEAMAERLKAARNRKADQLGLPRGTLLSNAVVLEVARIAPPHLQALAEIEGMRRWKVDAVGAELLAVLHGSR